MLQNSPFTCLCSEQDCKDINNTCFVSCIKLLALTMLNLSLSIAAGGVETRNVWQHYASWWHHGKATVVNRKFPTWESTLSLYTYSTFFLLLFLLFLFLQEFIQLQMHCHSHAPFALNCTHTREYIMLIVVDIAVYCNSLPNKAANSFQILEANLWAQMQECWSVGID